MGKRRKPGEGTVFQRADGSWVARLNVVESDGRERRVQRNAHSEEHGKILLSELRTQFPNRHLAHPSTMTVADFLDTWIRTLDRAPSTLDSYRRAVRNHVNPYLGTVLVRRLTAMQVREWLKILDGKCVGSRTRQNAFAVLRRSLEDAVGDAVIPANPCARVIRPKSVRGPIKAFTLDEVTQILKATETQRLAGVYQLALRLGLRQGELFGLRWCDVEGDTIHVRQQASEIAGKVVFKDPKSQAGIRDIPLDGFLAELLHARRVESMKEGTTGEGLVFTSRNGSVIRRSNWGHRHWKPLLQRLEIEHRGFHHCRHTAATLLLRSGAPLAVVSEILGHAKKSTTLDLYGHSLPDERGAAVRKLSELYG